MIRRNGGNRSARSSLLGMAIVTATSSCAIGRGIVSDSGDLADYRAFRVAAHEGVRLSRAEAYLAAHPKGAWASEVRAFFEEEEPLYFQKAQRTRREMREYLTYLPRGPHAEAALSLLVAFDTNMAEIALQNDVRSIRRNELRFERAREQRRRLGEAIIAGAAALADPAIFEHGIEDAPPALAQVLDGPKGSTWGGRPEVRRVDYFFLVPKKPEPESRFVELRVVTDVQNGKVVRAAVEGEDLFVRWLEADRLVALDPDNAGDRSEAAVFVLDVLAGVLEASLPRARCEVPASEDQLLVRSCDGRELAVVMGRSATSVSGIVVRRTRAVAPTDVSGKTR